MEYTPKVIERVVSETTHNFTFTDEEAVALCTVAVRIGGYCPNRFLFDNISTSLRKAGIDENPELLDPNLKQFRSIYFKSEIDHKC